MNEIKHISTVTLAKGNISETNTNKNAAINVNLSPPEFIKQSMTVPITETLLNLGPLLTSPPTKLGVIWVQNNDPNNVVHLKDAIGGHLIAKYKPGEAYHFRLPDGCTAPAVIADTAPAQIQYFIMPD